MSFSIKGTAMCGPAFFGNCFKVLEAIAIASSRTSYNHPRFAFSDRYPRVTHVGLRRASEVPVARISRENYRRSILDTLPGIRSSSPSFRWGFPKKIDLFRRWPSAVQFFWLPSLLCFLVVVWGCLHIVRFRAVRVCWQKCPSLWVSQGAIRSLSASSSFTNNNPPYECSSDEDVCGDLSRALDDEPTTRWCCVAGELETGGWRFSCSNYTL